jgi:hypothetical protein
MNAGPLHYEDLDVGQRWRTAARTVTEADIVAFAGVSGDFNPIHVDAEHAATTRFGERIAHGALVLAIALGHPLGCSGARLITTLVHELGRRPDARLGLATMCIGVGQGIAALIEKAEA